MTWIVFFFHRNETITEEEEEEMNISQEILVLDFGDEKNRDFLRSEASTEYGRGMFRRFLLPTFRMAPLSFIFIFGR